MDNASTNDVLARTLGILLLKRYGIQFSPENGQIRCLAHVVNLVVQKILSELDEADDPALRDYYEANKHLPIHYDPNEDEEIQAFHNEADENVESDSEDDGDEEEEEDLEDDLLNDPNQPGARTAVKKVSKQLGSLA